MKLLITFLLSVGCAFAPRSEAYLGKLYDAPPVGYSWYTYNGPDSTKASSYTVIMSQPDDCTAAAGAVCLLQARTNTNNPPQIDLDALKDRTASFVSPGRTIADMNIFLKVKVRD